MNIMGINIWHIPFLLALGIILVFIALIPVIFDASVKKDLKCLREHKGTQKLIGYDCGVFYSPNTGDASGSWGSYLVECKLCHRKFRATWDDFYRTGSHLVCARIEK